MHCVKRTRTIFQSLKLKSFGCGLGLPPSSISLPARDHVIIPLPFKSQGFLTPFSFVCHSLRRTTPHLRDRRQPFHLQLTPCRCLRVLFPPADFPPFQGCLTLGFLCATLLMGLHGKHQPMDQSVHFLLMLAMAAATVCSAAEAMFPSSFVLAAARSMLLMLIGTWFVQVGRILYLGGSVGLGWWVGGWVGWCGDPMVSARVAGC